MTASNTAHLPATVERQGLVQWAATKFGVDAGKVFPILKETCFRGSDGKAASDAEVAALMIVAREHGLNPFLKEIYAFPAKGGGIVPIVGIDGWISIVNSHPEFNGVEFVYENSEKPAWIECHMFRKDRTHPIRVREHMSECKRNTGPWDSHPTRMLRHKAYIQCARVAFGFAGIYDPDEGETIAAGHVIDQAQDKQPLRGVAGLRKAIGATAPEATRTTGGAEATTPTAEEVAAFYEEKAKPAGTVEQRDAILKSIKASSDAEVLNLVMDESREFEWTVPDLQVLTDAYATRRDELGPV